MQYNHLNAYLGWECHMYSICWTIAADGSILLCWRCICHDWLSVAWFEQTYGGIATIKLFCKYLLQVMGINKVVALSNFKFQHDLVSMLQFRKLVLNLHLSQEKMQFCFLEKHNDKVQFGEKNNWVLPESCKSLLDML